MEARMIPELRPFESRIETARAVAQSIVNGNPGDDKARRWLEDIQRLESTMGDLIRDCVKEVS